MDIVNEKYRDIEKAGKELFWKYGIKRISVKDICHKAGISRVTFYKYFPDKESLAIHILKEIIDQAFVDYRNLMDSNIPFETKIEKTIQMKLEGTKDISLELMHDINFPEFKKLQAFFMDATKRSLQMVIEDFSKAKDEGYIRKDVRIDFIIFFVNHLQTLISDPHLDKMYENTSDLMGELVRFFFYGIMNKDSERK